MLNFIHFCNVNFDSKGIERFAYVMTGGNTSLAKTANTELLVNNRSESLLKKARFLGTGSGFSDKDREFLQKMIILLL